jgi:hypothetical protein
MSVPGAFSNGQVRCDSRTCTFSCDAGYHMIGGSNSSRCTSFGSWSTGVGVCVDMRSNVRNSMSSLEHSCGPQETVANAQISCSDAAGTTGSWCQYRCTDGFEMVHGTTTRFCQDDGTWSGLSVVCKRLECPLPQSKVGVIGRCDGSTSGSRCAFTCAPGFKCVPFHFISPALLLLLTCILIFFLAFNL